MKVNLDISETELLELVQGFLPKNLSISSVGIRAGHVEIAGKLKKFLMWHGFRAGLDLRLADNGRTVSIKLISVKALMMEGLPTKLLKNALSSAFSNGKIPGVSYSHEDACVKITFAKLRLPRCITSGVLSELKLTDGVLLCFESGQMPFVRGDIQAKNADFACGVREPTDWPCECTLVGVHCGKTVCAESAGRRPLAASRDAYGGDWEKFTIIRNDDGSFSIKAAVNGKYVSAMPTKGGCLLAQGEKVDLWEKFDLREVDGKPGCYTLWSHVTKKYVSVDENKENVLFANRDSPDSWEWLRIRPLSGMTESCDSVLGRGLIGWNLGNALDANPDEEGWGNPRVSYELIRAVRDKGFGIVRIPVTWHCHTGQDGKIDPRWMARVAEVVGYAISVGLKVILNVHHDETAYIHAEDDGLEDGQNWLENVWRQIAVYFKDYGRSQLVFETMNEPRVVGSPNEWTEGAKRVCQYINRLNSSIVKIIRASGGENAHRLIMCPGHAAVVPSGDFVLPQDDHIAVSVHLYCPYAFAMDAEHGHADFTEEDKKVILEKFSQLSRRFVANGIPVVVGETGAINRGNHESRARWAQYFVSTATEFGLTCVIWDNGNLGEGKETFGLIDRRKLSWTYENVIDAAMAGIQHR